MGLRERVALVVLGIFLLQIYCSYCMPKAKKLKLQMDNLERKKSNFLTSKPSPVNTEKQPGGENDGKSTLKTFNFPEIQYPDILFHDKYIDSENIHEPLKQNHLKRTKKKVNNIKKNSNKHLNLPNKELLSEFSSAPNYRDFGKFFDVEYPLHASEMWKPIYWNSQINSPIVKESSYKTERNDMKTKKKTTKTSDKLLTDQLSSKRKKRVDSINNKTSKTLASKKNDEVLKEYLLPPKDNILITLDKNVSDLPIVNSPLKIVESCPLVVTGMPNNLSYNASTNDSLGHSNISASNICPLKNKKDSFVFFEDTGKLMETFPVATPSTFDTLSTTCPYRNKFVFPDNHFSITTKSPKSSLKSEPNFLTSTTTIPMLTCAYDENTLSINSTKVGKNDTITRNSSNKKHENITGVKNYNVDIVMNKNEDSAIPVDLDEEFTTDDPEFDESLNSMSTSAPMTSTTVDLWKKSVVLEPKMLPSVDELDDYFISV